jgi:hypothetical protein
VRGIPSVALANNSIAAGSKQVLISNQDKCEGGLLRQVKSKKHPYFFQRAHGVVLGFIQQQHRDEATEFTKGLFE